MKEIWRTINGFTDFEISNLGRVKSLKRKFASILKEQQDPQGYRQVGLRVRGNLKKYTKRIHNLVINHFGLPAPSELHEVNHIDGDKSNNQLSNLEWTTRRGNMEHNFKIGITDSFTWGKIDRVGLIATKEALKAGHKPKDIAHYFGTCVETIYNIKSGRSYRHV